jgi:hypothetical protein
VYTLDRYIDFERGVWSIGVTGCDLRDKLFIIRGIGIKDREKHAVSRKLRLVIWVIRYHLKNIGQALLHSDPKNSFFQVIAQPSFFSSRHLAHSFSSIPNGFEVKASNHQSQKSLNKPCRNE